MEGLGKHLGVLRRPVRLRESDRCETGYENDLHGGVDFGAANVWQQRLTQPIGTPDQIIAKVAEIQAAVSLGYLVIHVFYGGMPPEKAEKSLRLFADEVLPALHEMDTPIHAVSLGEGAPVDAR